MTQLIVDAALASKLQETASSVQLCTPGGQVLGTFVPKMDLSEWEPLTPEVSEEELDEQEQSPEWYTLDQVLAHLKSLEKQ